MKASQAFNSIFISIQLSERSGSLRVKMADFLWKITAAHAKNLSFMEKVLNLLGYLDGQTTVNRKEIDKVQT